MSDLDAFLESVGPFAALADEERRAVARHCVERTVGAGKRLLSQGEPNQILFVLRSGQVAVRTQHGDLVETIARLQPPAVIGEVSFITGRTCSAHIDVVADARVIELSRAALATIPGACDHLIRGLADVVAGRLHNVVTGTAATTLAPAVLISTGDHWTAPRAFALELARALSHETAGDTLIVARRGTDTGTSTIEPVEPGVARVALPGGGDEVPVDTLAQVKEWRARFSALVLIPPGASRTVPGVSSHTCALLGQGDAAPAESRFALVAQDARFPTLPVLSGARQLVPDVADAEDALANGRQASAAFRARVGSLARAVLGQQIGLALGAGGARGWSHAGVLDVFHRGGLPIDVVTGTSMGAMVGGLWAAGAGIADLVDAAAEWRRRWLFEWRVWRMHLASERRVERLFERLFGDGRVNQTAVPFWANAVDLERGEEVTLRDGLLKSAVRASMAFPGWIPPFAIEERLLVDGAVVNPAPAPVARAMGAGFVVTALAISPTGPQPLARRFPMRAYDVFSRAVYLSAVAMGQARSEASSDVVVVPDLGNATMLSFDRSRELMAAGAHAAEERLPAIVSAYAGFKRRNRAGN